MKLDLYSFEGANLHISGDVAYVVPPVPIPNTVVKHIEVESTWLETAWEDRKLPVKKSLIHLYWAFNLAVVVKWLTLRIVAPARVGSIPTNRPI